MESKPITEKDFTDLRDQLYPNMTDRACERFFEMSNRMAVDFGNWAWENFSNNYYTGNNFGIWTRRVPSPNEKNSFTTKDLFELYQQHKPNILTAEDLLVPAPEGAFKCELHDQKDWRCGRTDDGSIYHFRRYKFEP